MSWPYRDKNGEVESDESNLDAAAPDLLAALEAVEWVNGACPWCGWWESKEASLIASQHVGHAPDCPRQAALKKARGEE